MPQTAVVAMVAQRAKMAEAQAEAQAEAHARALVFQHLIKLLLGQG
jgi:hypothetical protein